MFPPEDTPALSKAIIDALSDTARLKKMGQAGRSLVAPVFSAETMVDKIDALYKQLIERAHEHPVFLLLVLVCAGALSRTKGGIF